jgi:hypothetical protein
VPLAPQNPESCHSVSGRWRSSRSQFLLTQRLIHRCRYDHAGTVECLVCCAERCTLQLQLPVAGSRAVQTVFPAEGLDTFCYSCRSPTRPPVSPPDGSTVLYSVAIDTTAKLDNSQLYLLYNERRELPEE